MNLARSDRTLLAWMLYFSVLFGALACSIGHGQMAGLQLSGLDGVYCSLDGGSASGSDFGAAGLASQGAAGGAGCALSSTFGALILAAFFGLLGLLCAARQPALPTLRAARPVRFLWPSANPRASPSL
ncbi:DUF2946 family protein [Pseudomonas sp. MBLB4136]|uniref:DUF2946 family protein n=1 Tax=Pseudomonas sp. MBLB4136 TaxID=3451558 RepID=UPI003F74E17B